MVQTFFERSFAIDRLRQGPLAGHIDLLAARLATHGYSRVHSRIQLRLVGHFNRWLEQKDLTVEQIDEELVERYWRYFMRKKRVRSKDVSALMKLLDLLREQGVTPRLGGRVIAVENRPRVIGLADKGWVLDMVLTAESAGQSLSKSPRG